ncbi:ATP-binding cassette domain-containing protein [Martelella alba]|uniref:ATP-binding cassette domain-containing protein n=1 Tax=Martelella alba TaxID=2590451 RepID=A0A506U091_9HYPH|nr:ATP-binding cassette domain-containing protein [Martelella alba]TPW26878.1 ATP-binding cassette domain-containing protein [Martelella alba]
MSLLDLSDIRFSYDRRRTTLDDVSLSVTAGRSVGLVGESGSGKSTILRLMLGLARQQSGEIRFEGERLDPLNRAFMRQYRRSVQAVFQDPYSSLDPRQKVRSIISEPLRSLAISGDHDAIVAAALEDVGLPEDAGGRYPHEFSGGQRQRIAIARAIAAMPKLLLADEAVSALDLSTRILIVDLFRKLAERMTLVFVSHDLGVVAALCEEMVILEKGRIVETGLTKEIIRDPQHPYTRRLLDSIPRMPQ